MIGIDITSISRFENKSESFIKKILSKEEILEYGSIKNKAKFLAIRWAIKESLFKANNKLANFSKITISKKNNKYFYEKYIISTTSEKDMVIAIVQKEK